MVLYDCGVVVDLEVEEPPWRLVDATVLSAARVVRRAYDVRLAPLEMNLTEARLVVYVNDAGPETQTRLADRLGMGRAAAGQVIDRLEARGLVARARHPDDRRVWLISPTKRGAQMRERIVQLTSELRDELRDGLTHEERSQLARLLVRMQHNATAVLDESEVAT